MNVIFLFVFVFGLLRRKKFLSWKCELRLFYPCLTLLCSETLSLFFLVKFVPFLVSRLSQSWCFFHEGTPCVKFHPYPNHKAREWTEDTMDCGISCASSSSCRGFYFDASTCEHIDGSSANLPAFPMLYIKSKLHIRYFAQQWLLLGVTFRFLSQEI